MFALILKQTVQLAFRKGGGAWGTLAFFVMAATLEIFALGPEVMRPHAGAMLCLALLLASVTALPLLFERDYEDGTLEQFLLQPAPLELLALARIFGHWAACALPALAGAPILAVMAGQDAGQAGLTALILLLASPSIVCIGAMAAALTLGNRRGGLLQALLALPLYIPLLIFAGAGEGGLQFLAGMLLALLPLACYACAALIRISQD